MHQPTLHSTSTDLSYDHQSAIAWALPITVALLAAVLLPHAIVYREDAFSAMLRATGLWVAAPAFLVSIIVHELMHTAAVVVFGRLRWRDVTYGVNWKTLTPYAHPRVPVTARAYAATAAAPGVLLGVVPAIIGLATGSGPWSGYGALMLGAAGGDALIIWSLRRTPGSALVQDHPSRVGCYVVSENGDGVHVEPPAAPRVHLTDAGRRSDIPFMRDNTYSSSNVARWTAKAFVLGLALGSFAAIVAVLN